MKTSLIAGCSVCAVVLALGAMAWNQLAPRERLIHAEDVEADRRDLRELGAPACAAGNDSGLGPAMVQLPEGFCMDTTEVTRSQYDAWLAGPPKVNGQSAACADNDDFTPSCSWPPGGNDGGKPVVCVDWCDAQAFCAAAGKRLCGQLGDGGAYAFASYDDPTVSEWHAACTSGGAHEYTYGNEPNSDACRDGDADDYTTWGMGDAGSFSDCHSPDADYADVYDLSGNVAEWDNGCDGDAPGDSCRIRGGSFEHQGMGLRCAMAKNLHWPRMRAVGSVGFRCCGDR